MAEIKNILTVSNADKDAEKLYLLHTDGGSVKWFSHSGKVAVSHRVKDTSCSSANPILDFNQKK